MIVLSIIATFACLCRVKKVSTINLVLIIICMRLCVSYIYYRKFGSLLALIWILVYLGGMMVCFVYILFITFADKEYCQRMGQSIESDNLLAYFLFTSIAWKAFLINSWNLYLLYFVRWSGSMKIYTEVYSQIICLSPFFFLLSACILLYGLLQILSILNMKNKTGSYCLL